MEEIDSDLLVGNKSLPNNYSYITTSSSNELLRDSALSKSSHESGRQEEFCEKEKKLIRQTKWRWLMLTFASLFQFGSYFCFDNPAPLKHELQSPPFNLKQSQWSGLYSIYALPNMIMPLFGGILVDKVGVR